MSPFLSPADQLQKRLNAFFCNGKQQRLAVHCSLQHTTTIFFFCLFLYSSTHHPPLLLIFSQNNLPLSLFFSPKQNLSKWPIFLSLSPSLSLLFHRLLNKTTAHDCFSPFIAKSGAPSTLHRLARSIFFGKISLCHWWVLWNLCYKGLRARP